MEHRFLYVHQLDKVKVRRRDRTRCRAHARVLHTKRGADRLVTQLAARGRAGAARSTATSRQAARERALADFSAGKVPVLVATDVAARGLHIDGVDVVVHYDPTDDHKAYLHRSGRTARAGETGVAVTLMLWNQENDVRTIQRRLGAPMPDRSRCSRTTRASPTCGPGTRPPRPTSPDVVRARNLGGRARRVHARMNAMGA